jgi:hypothetical protein
LTVESFTSPPRPPAFTSPLTKDANIALNSVDVSELLTSSAPSDELCGNRHAYSTLAGLLPESGGRNSISLVYFA